MRLAGGSGCACKTLLLQPSPPGLMEFKSLLVQTLGACYYRALIGEVEVFTPHWCMVIGALSAAFWSLGRRGLCTVDVDAAASEVQSGHVAQLLRHQFEGVACLDFPLT